MTDESLSFCIARVSTALLVSPAAGANSGGYNLELNWQNRSGSVGSSPNDFEVRILKDGMSKVVKKFNVLMEGVGGSATSRGISIFMPALPFIGTVDIQVTAKTLANLQMLGQFGFEDPTQGRFVSVAPKASSSSGGGFINVLVKYLQTCTECRIVAVFGTGNSKVLGTVLVVQHASSSDRFMYRLIIRAPRFPISKTVMEIATNVVITAVPSIMTDKEIMNIIQGTRRKGNEALMPAHIPQRRGGDRGAEPAPDPTQAVPTGGDPTPGVPSRPKVSVNTAYVFLVTWVAPTLTATQTVPVAYKIFVSIDGAVATLQSTIQAPQVVYVMPVSGTHTYSFGIAAVDANMAVGSTSAFSTVETPINTVVSFGFTFFNPDLMPRINELVPSSASAIGGATILVKLTNPPSTDPSKMTMAIGAQVVPSANWRFIGQDRTGIATLELKMPFLNNPDDGTVTVTVTVDDVPIVGDLSIFGWQARLVSITPHLMFSETRTRLTMTFTNFEDTEARERTYIVFGDTVVKNFKIDKHQGGTTTLSFYTPKIRATKTLSSVPVHTHASCLCTSPDSSP